VEHPRDASGQQFGQARAGLARLAAEVDAPTLAVRGTRRPEAWFLGPKATPRNKRAIGRSLRRRVAAPKSALMKRQFLGVALASSDMILFHFITNLRDLRAWL